MGEGAEGWIESAWGAGAGHSQGGIPDTESLQVATIKARLPGDIGTLGQRHHRHIGDSMGAGAWEGRDGGRNDGQGPGGR